MGDNAMLYKQDWEMTKSRLAALWDNEIIDRCCVSIMCDKSGRGYIPKTPPTTQEELFKYYADPQWIMEREIGRFESTYFGGDALPSIFPFLGTCGHAAYTKKFKIEFNPETIWFFPAIDDWEVDMPEFDSNSKILKAQKEMMRVLANEGKGKFFVSMPDNCGSMDALAHLRGSSELLMDMFDEPEYVKKAVDELVVILKKTGDELFDIVRENNCNGSIHGWMNTWCEGKQMQLQCDYSVMVSPATFEEFALPELEETTAWLDKAIYHLDGQEQIRHLDMILSVKKINMIQWTPVEGQPLTSEFIPVLKKIQEAGKGLVLFPQATEVEKLLSGLSSKGLMLNVRGIDNEEDAKEMIKKVKKWTRE